jgi:cytochrome c551/c552
MGYALPRQPRSGSVAIVAARARDARLVVLVAMIMSAPLPGCTDREVVPEHRVAGGMADRGRSIIAQTGCGACHTIPGVSGARGTVGPSLERFARRNLIGGVAPNRPAVLIQWVRAAPTIAPQTGMPRLPLEDGAARDVAAYLYTLR